MTGNELLRKLRRLARRKGVVFAFDSPPRRGGHGEIRFGDAITTLRSSRPKELPSGTLRAMLAQIGVDHKSCEMGPDHALSLSDPAGS